MVLARLDSTGKLEKAFAQDGLVRVSDFSNAREKWLWPTSVTVDSLGRIIVTGMAESANEGLRPGWLRKPASGFVLRLRPDGSEDSNFGQSGWVFLERDLKGSRYQNSVHQLKILSDGKYLVSGNRCSISSQRCWMFLSRLYAHGPIDTRFGVRGWVNRIQAHSANVDLGLDSKEGIRASSVVEFSAGNALLLGSYSASGQESEKFGNSGSETLVPVFSSRALNRGCTSGVLVMLPGSKSLIAGQCAVPSVSTQVPPAVHSFPVFARIGSDGALDSSFGKAGLVVDQSLKLYEPFSPSSLAALPNGKMLVANIGTNKSGPSLIRLNPDGSIDRSYVPKLQQRFWQRIYWVRQKGRIVGVLFHPTESVNERTFQVFKPN